MRTFLLMAAVVLGGCSSTMYSFKHAIGADQCTAPDAKEAKITKRAWTK